jgi:hypothetical protein
MEFPSSCICSKYAVNRHNMLLILFSLLSVVAEMSVGDTPFML